MSDQDKEYEAWQKEQANAVPDPTASALEAIVGGPGEIELEGAPIDGDDVAEPVEVTLSSEEKAEHEEALQVRANAIEQRGNAVWYAVVGIAMLFMSSFHWGIAVGGVLMVVYGGMQYLRWSAKAKAAYDPWMDDELDAWESEEFGA